MARAFDVIGSGGSEGSLFHISGTVLMLCMVVASISIISMVILACSEDPDENPGRKRRKHTPVVIVTGGGGC
ncbi:hypothetical protein IFM89_026323 [Coptis chinensis]|uniref:Uncharacterized protein n=1 Tax=Coptis chinensis TaxID=261450 RepID=A0A835LZR6_9MAGN|nr:hypothetical protein IFM89_026323 [Coptis chinensis]